MSNALAIAAVTATLRNLLSQGVTADQGLADTTITTQSPDQARSNGNTANQLNVFLYHASPNAAWRNRDIPSQINPGETSVPPLALNLFYLVTAYGRDNDTQSPFSHHLLGRAMSVLYDHCILGREEIKAALPGNDLHMQIERVRLTPVSVSTEESSKLWASFQTPYRPSVAYEAAVLLIESTRPPKRPLPILTRGKNDSGIVAMADPIPPFPTINELLPPNQQTTGQLGDILTVKGHHLPGNTVVLFKNRRLPEPIRLTPEAGGTAELLTVKVSDDRTKWVAGFYTVAVEVTDAAGTPEQRARMTNDVSFALAPTITNPFPIQAPVKKGDARIALTVSPEVTPDQRAEVIVGDQSVLAEPHPTRTDRLQFVVKAATKGEFFLRVRVDGLDSPLVDRSGGRPVFREQKVNIT